MTDAEKVTPPSGTPKPESPEEPETEALIPESEEPVAEASTVETETTTTFRGRRTSAAEPAEKALTEVEASAPSELVAETAASKTRVTSTSRKKPAATKVDSNAQYAVIATGGKQYRVKVGDRIQVERLHAKAGSDLTIDQVLLLGGDGSTRIGTPVVDGASVTAHIDEHGRGDKIVVFKFKAKKRYRRRTGHRQELTRLTITGISG